jgi:pimeloyl-ACP methyl ester carboxylesterase
VIERDVTTPDGRTLHAYDTGGDGPVVVWHHGTPNLGPPPVPLIEPGVRWVGYDRPGYGGSTPRPGRDVASAAADVAAVADALGLGRFAVLGHSGGGPHALACAALLADRVTAAAAVSSPAPYGGFDYFAGMAEPSAASLRAATGGRAAKERYEAAAEPADPGFVPADLAALAAEWGWFDSVVGPALADGPGPLVDDDLAYVHQWGFDLAAVGVPVLCGHGADDRVVPASHGRWIAAHVPGAELRIAAGDGHISVLRTLGPDTVHWLLDR